MKRLRELITGLPEYAAELRLNFDAIVIRQQALTPDQLCGAVVACVLAARCHGLTAAALADAADVLRPEVLSSAQTSAAMMTLTNGFYGWGGLSAPVKRAGLRVNSLRQQRTVPVEDFALWCLAVSAFHGCAPCMAAQERTLRNVGSRPERIAGVLRVQALIRALAVVVDAQLCDA